MTVAWALLLSACAVGGLGGPDLPRAGEYPGIDETSRPLTPLAIDCTFDPVGGVMTVKVQGGEAAIVGRATDGTMTTNGVICATARATTVRRLDIAEDAAHTGDETLVLDLADGFFALGASDLSKSGVHVDLGTGSDSLKIQGSTGADVITLGTNGIAVNSDAYVDVVVASLSAIQVVVSTGAGNDTISGAGGFGSGGPFAFGCSLFGGAGNDTLTGGAADDKILGGDGDDILNGGAGNDTLWGEEGNDTFRTATGTDGADAVFGGNGIDFADYSGRTADLTIAMDATWIGGTYPNAGSATGTPSGEGVEGDLVGTDVENLTAGSGNDTVTGNALNNTLKGGAGNDTFVELASSTSSDVYIGGAGSNTVDYSAKTVPLTLRIDGLADSGDLAGGEADAIGLDIGDVIGGQGGDRIYGSAVANVLNGGTGNDTLYGGDGDDILIGGSGNDLLYGENGDDTFRATGTSTSDGDDTIVCGQGANDILDYSSRTVPVTIDLAVGSSSTGMGGEHDTLGASADDCENAVGGAGLNVLRGNSLDNILDGFSGGASFDGRGGVDVCMNAGGGTTTGCEL